MFWFNWNATTDDVDNERNPYDTTYGFGTDLAVIPVYPRTTENVKQIETDNRILSHCRDLLDNCARRPSGFVSFGGRHWIGSTNRFGNVHLELDLASSIVGDPNHLHTGLSNFEGQVVQVDGFIFKLPSDSFQIPLPLPPGTEASPLQLRRDFVFLTMRYVL